MLEAEADGLAELARAGELRVPRVDGVGDDGGRAFLLVEWLELRGGERRSAERLGAGLAALHRHTAEAHGWHRDNTIGATPQPNARDTDWWRFWAERRLGFQLELAAANGLAAQTLERGARLIERLPGSFGDHRPPASLLHGDLWGGNWGTLPSGEPVIFDPAVYYGDRETDLAMTRLFGGFPPAFYAAYARAWPLPPGADRRLALYQLYHVLNHYNLFGGGYAGQAERLLRELA
jgi:fructosamine-3-kinase